MTQSKEPKPTSFLVARDVIAGALPGLLAGVAARTGLAHGALHDDSRRVFLAHLPVQ